MLCNLGALETGELENKKAVTSKRLKQKNFLNLLQNDLGESLVFPEPIHIAIRFGNIAIEVTHISPDTFVESDGSAYYKVILEPATDYFEKGSSRYNLVPGVEVVSSIHTGERSVLKYIFEPFLTSADSALQER